MSDRARSLDFGVCVAGADERGPLSLIERQDSILSFSKLPSNVVAEIEATGESVNRILEEIDAVLVTATAPDFPTAVAGLRGLSEAVHDATVDWLPEERMIEFDPEHIGSDETYFDLFQWSMLAVDAPGGVGRGGHR